MEKLRIEDINEIYQKYGVNSPRKAEEVRDFPLPNRLVSGGANNVGFLSNKTEYDKILKIKNKQ